MKVLGHQPALDGLRGVAVILIMALHAGVPFSTGGFVGLELFFALSGFLVTKLLLQQRDRDGRFRVGRFLSRRVYRLLPAFAVLLVAVTVAPTVFVVTTGRREILQPLLLQYSNLAQAAGDAGDFGLLQHTWSLALEEQFYVAWALVLLVCSAASDRVIAAVGAALSATSFLLLAMTYVEGPAPSAYYRLDTRAGTLLLGAVAAVAVHRGWVRPGRPLLVGGYVAALGLVVSVPLVSMGAHQAAVFRFGFLLAGLAATAVVITIVLHPDALLARGLRARILTWAGVVSYALYLWHPPLYHWSAELLPGEHWLPPVAVGTAASVAAAIVSLHLVERPALRLRDRRDRSQAHVEAGPEPLGVCHPTTASTATVPATAVASSIGARS